VPWPRGSFTMTVNSENCNSIKSQHQGEWLQMATRTMY
jgi:hypothetical protein